MKFYVKDKKRHEYFSGQIVSYDGVSGKYGAYFPSDGEVVFIEPDDKDVIYLDWCIIPTITPSSWPIKI